MKMLFIAIFRLLPCQSCLNVNHSNYISLEVDLFELWTNLYIVVVIKLV